MQYCHRYLLLMEQAATMEIVVLVLMYVFNCYLCICHLVFEFAELTSVTFCCKQKA